MKFIIHDVLLYPKNVARIVRGVHFEPGVVNVVTGTSARGKSAIGHIVDYCLGSGKCAIPVGIVRETVAWYALVVELHDQFLFIARREPEEQQATDDYCISDVTAAGVPLRPEKNSNRAAFKSRMDELCGLPTLDFAAGERDSGYGRASFRDMAAFNFLPQHIVANPQTLFAKTDTTEHREKLRRIFPLVLGAIDASYLLAQHEERDLRARVQRLEEELARRRKAADTWHSELLGLYSRAKEVGLVDQQSPPPQSTSAAVAVFRRVVDQSKQSPIPPLSKGNTEVALAELRRISLQESTVAGKLSQDRRNLQRIQDLSAHLRAYGDQLLEEQSRVVGAGWFQKHLSKNGCPFCGSDNQQARDHVKFLAEASAELQGLAKSAQQTPAGFEKEEASLRVTIRAAEEELQILRQQRRELDESSREAARAQQQMSEIYRLVGRLEQSISNAAQVAEDGDFSQRLQDMRNRLTELRKILNNEAMESKIEVAVAVLSRLISKPARSMDLERSSDLIQLVPAELTLRFRSASGRNDYLWEIGSGENWMGYHIAAMIALHQFFLDREKSPVPAFLIIDQPTQVYFPARNDTYDKARREKSPETIRDGDFGRARRIFEALATGVRDTKGRLQVIVTEHADELTWGGIDGVKLVENWRGDKYLIPESWREDTISGQENVESLFPPGF